MADGNSLGRYRNLPGLGQAFLWRWVGPGPDSGYRYRICVRRNFHSTEVLGLVIVAICASIDGWADAMVDIAHDIFRIRKLGEEYAARLAGWRRRSR